MAKQGFYAVQIGRVPGVYTTWDECKAQVDGYPNSKYQKFKTEAEANAFVGGLVAKKTTAVESLANQTTSVASTKEIEGPYAFVDGSFNPATNVYGYGGFVCVNGRKFPVTGHGNDAELASMRNVAGEIAGAMAAVKKAEELKLRELTILYDYRGIEQWAIPAGQPGHWKTTKQGTREYAEFMSDENRLTKVRFEKVAAHTGIEGNEMADVMAKHAVGIALTPTQQKLYDKAMNCGRRDGVLGFEDMESPSQSQSFEF